MRGQTNAHNFIISCWGLLAIVVWSRIQLTMCATPDKRICKSPNMSLQSMDKVGISKDEVGISKDKVRISKDKVRIK